ncbi:MAG: SUMF1/EgtB/PvdO family nonheme iron enzyme, partial [Planctomycetota bacterium]
MRTSIAFVCFAAITVLASVAQVSHAAEATLQDAIKARTEVIVLREEVGELDAGLRRSLRKVIAKGEGQQLAGNTLLTKDKYAEAVEAYGKAAVFYRQALNGRKILERLAETRKKASRASMLAEASADAKKLSAARRLEMNADGYEQAGEFEGAIAELEKAQAAYEKLQAPGKPATLEEAVGARRAMLAARNQVRGLSGGTGVSPWRHKEGRAKLGSLPDVAGRALRAQAAAAEALEGREYTPARALFVQAEALYRRAAVLEAKHGKVVAAQKTAGESLKRANAAFQTEARPASFELGKQCLADGSKALEEEDLDEAGGLFGDAVKFFAKAQAEATVVNAFAQAQEAWARAVAEADDALLTKHAAGGAAAAAKAKAEQAEKKAGEGQVEAGTELLKEATAAFTDAAAKAVTAENAAKAGPVIARLERLIADKEKYAAEEVLAELEKLIPSDPRMVGLRRQVAGIPGLKRQLTVDLGRGVKMDFVLIRPGSFRMGSEENDIEKPVREVTITKPFYMGKYEVTQEQWEALMRSNPSHVRGKRHPVAQVSWHDCQGFLQKLNTWLMASAAASPAETVLTAALPTEAEWEYACRAGSTTKYYFGDEVKNLGDHAWYVGNSGESTHPVGEKKPNAWGLYDMYGNVWEWCEDWYGKYRGEGPQKDPTGAETGESRVVRGGACQNRPVRGRFRSAYRHPHGPSNRYICAGLRVALFSGAQPEKAQAAGEEPLAPVKSATLEEAVGARTAMLAARKQVRGLSAGTGVSPWQHKEGRAKLGSLPDVAGRALRAQAAAAIALEDRKYTPARALFAQAEGLYRRAAVLEAKRGKVVATQKTAQESLKRANAAFKTEARPASFERGKQCLADGSKELEEEDLDEAAELFANAAKFFAKAQAEATVVNTFAQAQEAWARAVAAADDALLTKHADKAAAAAKAKAEQAEKKACEGQVEAGTELLKEATSAFEDAAAKAVTAENAGKAAPIIARLDRLVANKKKYAAEDVLAELEKLIPSDPRMVSLRRQVAGIPGLKRRLTVDLGLGVKMDFVLIRPGSFKMGSEES